MPSSENDSAPADESGVLSDVKVSTPLGASIVLKKNYTIEEQDPAWQEIPKLQNVVGEMIDLTFACAILPKEAEGRFLHLTVVLANDELLHILNREHRGIDRPTNILTFATLDSDEPMSDAPLDLGDVYLSYQRVKQEAESEGKFLGDHLRHLVVHGVLHLLKYDHQNEDQATDMETLEIRILERKGIQNPYLGT